MTNIEKYRNAFMESLDIKEEQLDGLKYHEITEWDSVGHMTLMAALEDVFNITMEVDDIMDFTSYDKGLEILKNNYNITF